MHHHWQNLDEDHKGKPKGRGWRQGRAWLYNVPYNNRQDDGVRVWPPLPREQGVEWHLFGRSISFTVGYSRDNEDHRIRFCLPKLCYMSYAWQNKGRRSTSWRDDHVDWSLRHFNGGLWWMLGANPMGGPSTWREGNIHWADLIFGRRKYQRVITETRTMPLPLPERTVTATVEESESTWTRKRWPHWPLTKRHRSYNVKPEYPAPVPGKGENAWDCDDDAIYEMSCGASSFEDAIGHFVASVLRDRRRHGGSYEWRERENVAA